MWPVYKSKYIGKRFGEYTVEKTVGEGRYGICFMARSEDGTPVILKKFRPGIFAKNSNRNAFEAVILSHLKDTRIPDLLGVINVKGFYGFVLEFKEGTTLKDLLFKQKHHFTEAEFCNIGLQLIRIIAHLHSRGVVHRDIRIPNILVHKGTVSLIDFGLARWADGNRYRFDQDSSFLGDVLLYLRYSSFETPFNQKKAPWYEELPLDDVQTMFIKRLLLLEPGYADMHDVEHAFIQAFGGGNPQNADRI